MDGCKCRNETAQSIKSRIEINTGASALLNMILDVSWPVAILETEEAVENAETDTENE